LNPGGRKQAEIIGNNAGFEDVSRKKVEIDGRIGSRETFDFNDFIAKIGGKTVTINENRTEAQTIDVTREKIVDPTTAYAGFDGVVQTNGAAVVGAHIGVKKSDIKVNKDGEIVPDGGIRPFVEGQLNAGTNGTNAALNVTGNLGANIGPAPSLQGGVSGTAYLQGVVETDQEFQGNIAGRGNWSVAKDQTIFAQVKQGFVGEDDTTLEVGYEFNRTRVPIKSASEINGQIDAAVVAYLGKNPQFSGTLVESKDGSVTPLVTPANTQGAGKSNKIKGGVGL
jgi:hypothetical protein